MKIFILLILQMIFKQSFQQDYNKENNSTTLKLLTEQIIDNKNISYQTQE